jgi:RNA polymerase sigma factor (sigma-70 family)
MTPEEIFLANLRQIERIIDHACRRHHLSREEAQDFASTVKLKLIEDDYAILRKFKGQSSLGTYLTMVIQRQHLDYMNHLWGKWRPCAEAERLGPVAIRLDALRNRDGYSFEEACEILRTNHHVEMSWQELSEIDARLPPRSPRPPRSPWWNEREVELENVAAENEQTDGPALSHERAAALRKVKACLRKALADLSSQDRLIIKMRIWSDVSVVGISRALHIEQKPLYRRIEKIQKTLREALEKDGIRAEEVSEILNVREH